MAVQLNHTIVHARDRNASAQFYAEILGLPQPRSFGPFMVVDTANGVSLDFISANDDEIIIEHYAFLVSEAEFDEIFARIKARNLDYWADPAARRKGEAPPQECTSFAVTPADYDGSGFVDIADTSDWTTDYNGGAGAWSPRLDLNLDGSLTSADSTIYTSEFGGGEAGGGLERKRPAAVEFEVGAKLAFELRELYPATSPYHYARPEDVPADIAYSQPFQIVANFVRDLNFFPNAVAMLIPAARAAPAARAMSA